MSLVVIIPRDFDAEPLEGQEIAQVVSMYNSGLVDQSTLGICSKEFSRRREIDEVEL